jgi:uncharacterized lipoprotein YddW (UPF0748 family)
MPHSKGYSFFNSFMHTAALALIVTAIGTFRPASAQNAPKREFRGAWIQCVNNQFNGMGRDKMQQVLTSQLDVLKADGINAILFQVRPEGDALYQSNLEPWSRYLTGQQGVAPEPYWDPLQWMVEQCHARGMELHAWINPYRAKTKGTTELASNHPYKLHPERFFSYDDMLFFDPGLPENRAYICQVVQDIVKRYDIDGLHIDDYFYPYPVAGQSIPDDKTFAQYANGYTDRGEWRRYNVNLLMRDLCQTVHQTKPWVKFGVSPFGIYRNKKNAANGSDTNGLQNYDDLYADVLMWVKNGWTDYIIPQIYWEIGNKAADYETLIQWWSNHTKGRPLYIGQDVERTVKYADVNNPNSHQMIAKMTLQRSLPNIQGSCQWYAKAVVDNPGNYGTMLQTYYHKYPALQPLMPFLDNKAPGKVKKLKPIWTSDGYILFWTAPKGSKPLDEAVKYVVYRFAKGEKRNLENPENIVAITDQTFYKLAYSDGKTRFYYMVTSLDRLNNESKAVRKRIKL